MGSPSRVRVMSQMASKSPLANKTGWWRRPLSGALRAYAILAASLRYHAFPGRNPVARNISTSALKSAAGQSAGSGAIDGARWAEPNQPPLRVMRADL